MFTVEFEPPKLTRVNPDSADILGMDLTNKNVDELRDLAGKIALLEGIDSTDETLQIQVHKSTEPLHDSFHLDPIPGYDFHLISNKNPTLFASGRMTISDLCSRLAPLKSVWWVKGLDDPEAFLDLNCIEHISYALENLYGPNWLYLSTINHEIQKYIRISDLSISQALPFIRASGGSRTLLHARPIGPLAENRNIFTATSKRAGLPTLHQYSPASTS